MKLIKATVLAKSLGISRRTVADWCAKDPKLAVRKGRDYWIRVDVLATRDGMDIVQALLCTNQRWVKAIDLAAWAEVPRRTVAYWCQKRSWFGRRIGRTWYVDLEALGASPEQAEALKKWAPSHKSAADFVGFASVMKSLREHVGQDEPGKRLDHSE